MYVVKTSLPDKDEREWTPIHIVLEEKLDAFQVSNSLRKALHHTQFPHREYATAIRGLYNLLNELANIQRKSTKPAKPCGESRCICPYVRLK